MKRPIVTLYAVCETYQRENPRSHAVVSVKAEEFITGWKLRFPDLEPARGLAMRAFGHRNWIERKGRWANARSVEHYLSARTAISYFLRHLKGDIESQSERLQETKDTFERARKALRS